MSDPFRACNSVLCQLIGKHTEECELAYLDALARDTQEMLQEGEGPEMED